MTDIRDYSILFPDIKDAEYKQLSKSAIHDLGLDVICRSLSSEPKEQGLILDVLSNMTSTPEVSSFRQDVFDDFLRLPELRDEMTELFERIEYIRNFGLKNKSSDEKLGLWHLMHRLSELGDYISCVEEMKACLEREDIRSEGLVGFRKYVTELYNDSHFEELKKDVTELKTDVSGIRSVTLGVNVNSRFEATSLGLISVNNEPFRKSNIISNFADSISKREGIRDGNEWNGEMRYHEIEKEKGGDVTQNLGNMMAMTSTPFVDARIRSSTVAEIMDGDGTSGSTFYLEGLLNKMLDSIVKKLRDTLAKYSNISIVNISRLIPEFIYYIRFACFIEKATGSGFIFTRPQVTEGRGSMRAEGFYNLKLALSHESMDGIVTNDLVFDLAHTVYILTGANRGGKTTVTQAAGILYVLAQGGVHVPAVKMEFSPVDCIYTHFPADEDQTTDLGRLGEECVRFREIYSGCSGDSLVLLNETFSTTSFEEGYYIAKDCIRALLKKGTRRNPRDLQYPYA